MKRHLPFLLCLLLPLVALYELSGRIEWRLLLIFGLTLSSVAYFLVWRDKRRAERGGWRISEATLHLTELLGGWPGAYLAQQQFRHKTTKRSYRVVFYMIIGLYQILALEVITNWRISRWILSRL